MRWARGCAGVRVNGCAGCGIANVRVNGCAGCGIANVNVELYVG